MRQTHQHPFAGGGSFSPNLKAPKAQMVFDPRKNSLCARLSPAVKCAPARRQETLFHPAALLPGPSPPPLTLWVVCLAIGSALRRTQHQNRILTLNLRNLLGVIVTLIHQHRAGSTRFRWHCRQRRNKFLRIVRRITQVRSDNEPALTGIDYCLRVVALHRTTSSPSQASTLRLAHTRRLTSAPAPRLILSTRFTRRLSTRQNPRLGCQQLLPPLLPITQLLG